jgi:hypothetical protein
LGLPDVPLVLKTKEGGLSAEVIETGNFGFILTEAPSLKIPKTFLA